jgi:pilus assembly protein CpaB
MDAKKIVLLVGALVMAGITAFMARTMMAGAAAPQAVAAVQAPKIDGPEVLVATRALPIGTILDATALKFQPWPKEMVEDAYYIKGANVNLQSLQGTVVRNAITAGQPVTQGALVKPGDRGFLAAALGPGMRAVTVPVSLQSGVAGFVFPGDRVDLMLTQSVSGGGDGPPLKVAETFLRNVRVLATDQRTVNEVDDKGQTVPKTANNVTVEVTPKIAEKISVAQTVGSLSLSLRSIADNQSQLEEAIANGSVNVSDDPKAEKKMLADVASRPQEDGETFATGADVSKFQRRTVPGKAGDAGPQNFGAQPSGGSTSGGASPVLGPVVHIARGNAVTDVPVGGKK